jgi:hypothetical protein
VDVPIREDAEHNYPESCGRQVDDELREYLEPLTESEQEGFLVRSRAGWEKIKWCKAEAGPGCQARVGRL